MDIGSALIDSVPRLTPGTIIMHGLRNVSNPQKGVAMRSYRGKGYRLLYDVVRSSPVTPWAVRPAVRRRRVEVVDLTDIGLNLVGGVGRRGMISPTIGVPLDILCRVR